MISCSLSSDSFPDHSECIYFDGFLAERTGPTETDCQAIESYVSFDAVLRPNFSANYHGHDQVDDWNDICAAVKGAGLSQLLGDPSERVARNEVRDDTDADIAEATAQMLLEIAHPQFK